MDLRSEVEDDERAEALLADDPSGALSPKYLALLKYVRRLTLEPATCRREHVDGLREAGATDEEIHGTVQVAAYFNYINRIADALGVDEEAFMDKHPRR